jgi:hypothetical protein
MHEKIPLYRKINSRTHGIQHGGGDYKWVRGTKEEKRSDVGRGKMHGKRRNGLDYTPLFKFLLANVGKNWDEVYSAAVLRLDDPEPIFWLVARSEEERQAVVRLGENSYYSGLFVDENNLVALVDPSLRIETMKPACACFTHTFNGKPYVRAFEREL